MKNEYLYSFGEKYLPKRARYLSEFIPRCLISITGLSTWKQFILNIIMLLRLYLQTAKIINIRFKFTSIQRRRLSMFNLDYLVLLKAWIHINMETKRSIKKLYFDYLSFEKSL